MGPQIDFMVQSGLLDAELAADHPDRNCLMSVLMGAQIAKVDCPTRPLELKAGDIIVCSSDGLQFLTNAQIAKILGKYRRSRSTEIAERLLDEIYKLDDPDQDNISFTIIKVNDASVRPKSARPAQASGAIARPRGLTTVVTVPDLQPIPPAEDAPAAEPEEIAAAVAFPMAEVVEIETALREAAEEAEAADEERMVVVPRRFAALA